jgi:hypothetical protein
MAIRFLCPYGHHLVVPDERAGKKGRCPVCHQRVIVPVSNPLAGKRAKPSFKAVESLDSSIPWDPFASPSKPTNDAPLDID